MSTISTSPRSEARAEAAPELRRKSDFVFSRLGSFLSVAPLGVWTAFHLWNNLSAFQGAEAWQRAVTAHPHPVAEGLTFVLVFAPLLIHSAWGIQRLFSSRPNVQHYGFYGNLKYVLQRVTAIGVLAFLGAHLWLAFLHPRLIEGGPEPFADIAGEMRHHLPTLLVYLLGTLGVSFHLANGLQTWLWGWGALGSQRAIERFDRVALLLFGVLLLMSWGAIYALWSAGAAFSGET